MAVTAEKKKTEKSNVEELDVPKIRREFNIIIDKFFAMAEQGKQSSIGNTIRGFETAGRESFLAQKQDKTDRILDDPKNAVANAVERWIFESTEGKVTETAAKASVRLLEMIEGAHGSEAINFKKWVEAA